MDSLHTLRQVIAFRLHGVPMYLTLLKYIGWFLRAHRLLINVQLESEGHFKR